jgi:hypothetical protein
MRRVADQQARTAHVHIWRVPAWIRICAVAVFGLLCFQQWDIIRRAGFGEMPWTEVRNGYVFLTIVAVALFMSAFRPMLRIDPTGGVYVRNPVGSRRFRVGDVRNVSIDHWGLVISLTGARFARSIVFQATRSFSEPRWLGVAEALTGGRPEPHHDQSDCWDEDSDA